MNEIKEYQTNLISEHPDYHLLCSFQASSKRLPTHRSKPILYCPSKSDCLHHLLSAAYTRPLHQHVHVGFQSRSKRRSLCKMSMCGSIGRRSQRR